MYQMDCFESEAVLLEGLSFEPNQNKIELLVTHPKRLLAKQNEKGILSSYTKRAGRGCGGGWGLICPYSVLGNASNLTLPPYLSGYTVRTCWSQRCAVCPCLLQSFIAHWHIVYCKGHVAGVETFLSIAQTRPDHSIRQGAWILWRIVGEELLYTQ